MSFMQFRSEYDVANVEQPINVDRLQFLAEGYLGKMQVDIPPEAQNIFFYFLKGKLT